MNEFENHKNYNCRITTDDGQEFLVYGNFMHNEQLDHWKGWECDVGHTRLMIDKELNVWSGECRNDFLGSVFDQFYPDKPSVCKRETCTGCTDDLVTRKKKL